MRYYRKIIRVCAEDSPNVRAGREVVPGVLTLEEYTKRRATWDEVRQCVGLDAQFYKGSEVFLFPRAWLDHSHRLAADYHGRPRKALAIGIDPGEGVAESTMAAVDEWGLLDIVSKKTPDTSIIVGEAIAFMTYHKVPPDMVAIDRGGGGKQHADALRAKGYPVRTVGFGEAVTPDPRRGLARVGERLEAREERYVYFNRRAEMYGGLRELMDPAGPRGGFALPAEYAELRRQLAPIPLTFDREGRLRLLPKNRQSPDSKERTLTDLLGCSPDAADALVLAVWAMQNRVVRRTAGAV